MEAMRELVPELREQGDKPQKNGDSDEVEEEGPRAVLVAADRLTTEHFAEALEEVSKQKPDMNASRNWHSAWLT